MKFKDILSLKTSLDELSKIDNCPCAYAVAKNFVKLDKLINKVAVDFNDKQIVILKDCLQEENGQYVVKDNKYVPKEGKEDEFKERLNTLIFTTDEQDHEVELHKIKDEVLKSFTANMKASIMIPVLQFLVD